MGVICNHIAQRGVSREKGVGVFTLFIFFKDGGKTARKTYESWDDCIRAANTMERLGDRIKIKSIA